MQNPKSLHYLFRNGRFKLYTEYVPCIFLFVSPETQNKISEFLTWGLGRLDSKYAGEKKETPSVSTAHSHGHPVADCGRVSAARL